MLDKVGLLVFGSDVFMPNSRAFESTKWFKLKREIATGHDYQDIGLTATQVFRCVLTYYTVPCLANF